MKQQEEKQEYAGRALKNIKPIAPVIVIESVWSGFGGNKNAVNRVENERKKNAENFDKQQIRNMMNIADRVVKSFFAAHSFGVGKYMNEKKRAERNDPGYLMQLSQKKSFAQFNRHLLLASFGRLINFLLIYEILRLKSEIGNHKRWVS